MHSSVSLLPPRTVTILWMALIIFAATSAWAPSTIAATLTVAVHTDSSIHYTGDNISVYGLVLRDGVPVFNASVALEIHDPVGGVVVTRSIQTNSSGEYTVTFKLSIDALAGSYTVYANCAYGGETGSADTSFQLMQISPLKITIASDKTRYYVGDDISLGGNVTLNAAKLPKALVAVEVLNPNLEPIIVRVMESDGQGNYVLTFQAPQGSLLGTYVAYASVNYAESNATAETSFLLEPGQVSADLNGDGKVNIVDLTLVAKAWGSHPGDSRWNPQCDLNGDNLINIIDITLVARAWAP
jgi:uncharacterized protein YfaS (alpha-2-macroglobulin family)